MLSVSLLLALVAMASAFIARRQYRRAGVPVPMFISGIMLSSFGGIVLMVAMLMAPGRPASMVMIILSITLLVRASYLIFRWMKTRT